MGGFDAPQVKICAPVGCRVLDSKIPQLTGRDSHILVFDYPSTEVTKFMLDGTEEFHELSQAFFHHVAWATNGNAMLFDLKVVAVGDSVYLILGDSKGPFYALIDGHLFNHPKKNCKELPGMHPILSL